MHNNILLIFRYNYHEKNLSDDFNIDVGDVVVRLRARRR